MIMKWRARGFRTHKSILVTEDENTGNITKAVYEVEERELTKEEIEEELF